jgi:hypothetical protein
MNVASTSPPRKAATIVVVRAFGRSGIVVRDEFSSGD